MSRAFVRQEAAESDIDLTPMLDVVFIMLIFFIVTATFINEKGLEMNNPDKPANTINPPPPIFVRISEHGDIWVGETVVDIRAVRANIERLAAESPKSSLLLQMDDKAKTHWMIQVMDQSRAAGVWNINIAEKP